jgi:hypothetical protein
MYLLSLKNKPEEGVYAVINDTGKKVLLLFEEYDDADRYSQMLEEQEDTLMKIIEIDKELALATCKLNSYDHIVITPNDIVIPPKYD